MLKSVVPEQYRQKAPLTYKDSVVYKILVLSALMSVGTFCIALVYYIEVVEPSPTTNMFDCGGMSCKGMYKELSGCEWPTFYSGEFRFTTIDDDHHADEYSHGDEEDWFGRRRILREDDYWQEDNHWQEDDHQQEDDHRQEDDHQQEDDHWQEDDQCEPKGGNYWIIAGQHYGAGQSLENVLVRVSDYEFDIWSVVNLSWNAASMTWTLSSVLFSLILGLGGDRFVHPEILESTKEIELAKRTTQ